MKPGRETLYKRGYLEISANSNDLREVDFYQWFLGGDMFNNIVRGALKHAANEVKKATREELKSVFPQAFNKGGKHRYIGGKPTSYSDRMSDAVRVGRFKGYGNHMETSVHIMGVRSKDSGTYRLRFYEGGGSRKQRGAIPGYWFFRKGVRRINIWQTVRGDIDAYLQKHHWN